jgi:hypothetical protein
MRGQCLCGSVEFEVAGKVPRLYQCHCSLCRRQGGASSNAATIIAADQFRWLAGQEHIASWVKDTGFRSDFCSNCGSPVPNVLRGTPYYWVPAGLLDKGEHLEVGAHLFVGSKASWDVIASPGIQYETMPELSELVALLRSDGHA